MQLDGLSGTDVELIVMGVLCLVFAGSWAIEPYVNLVAVSIFVFLATVCFVAAWWDVRRRATWSAPWE